MFTYNHVITTLPLGVLANVDTFSLDLSLKKRMSIRMLGYSASVKIAIKFKTRWWQDSAKMNGMPPIRGGQTLTDLPIRKIVYPSYGLDCGSNATGSLLVSYTWAQDAMRLGSRVSPKTPSQRTQMTENDLIEDTLAQLTTIHGEIVRQEYDNKYYVINWNDNPLSMGAFAVYLPSQFQTLYRDMIRAEADGYVHFAGEHASVHHGWLEGAMNSAYRSVMEILMKENMTSKLDEMKSKWGVVDELEFYN